MSRLWDLAHIRPVTDIVLAGDTMPSELGQITLVNFTNPGGLEALESQIAGVHLHLGYLTDETVAQERAGHIKAALEKAGKPDCRRAHADKGLLGVVPLAQAALSKDGDCRW